MKQLISQNTDGLHRRSGIWKSQMCELHGNSNLEECRACGAQYLRDFATPEMKLVFNKEKNRMEYSHQTSRRCEIVGCGKPLFDTIINFGENLLNGTIPSYLGEFHNLLELRLNANKVRFPCFC